MTTRTNTAQSHRLMHFSDSKTIEMFSQLPGHRGISDKELKAIELELSVTLPPTYSAMMRLYADRLVAANIVKPSGQLRQIRDDAIELLIEGGHTFALSPTDLVFAWDEIFAFYFVATGGSPDPPVFMFNYYSSDNDWKAVVVYDTLTSYFADRLRRYMQLPPFDQGER